MLFHTWTFAVFFLVVYAVYLPLRRTRFWLPWLLVASYVFYGWWNPLYLLLLFYATALDFLAVILIERSPHRRWWLIASLANNVLLLGFFKYAGFLAGRLNDVLWLSHAGWQVKQPQIVLPVGISFFTFQSMSYVIDCYRGRIDRERNFIRFAAFVSFFPQLVAGPIERARNMLPQLRRLQPLTGHDITDGMSLFLSGLFKKVAIANTLAMYVEPIYASPGRHNGFELAAATFAFAWQIYCDFSGYTDMARGLARLLGFHLMLNFAHPYLASGLGDFWSRWHISLSSWFRDYLYIPLGGSRGGSFLTARNIFLTMVISGLWHGANWTFIVWGALHGAAYAVTRHWERTTWYERIPVVVRRAVVFSFVCFTWIFFRAKNMSDASTIVLRIVRGPWGDPRFPVLALILILALWLYEAACESPARSWIARPVFRVTAASLIIVYLCTAPGSGEVPFIYFQF